MAEKDGLFECNEPGCNYAFSSFDQLELHREIGTHSRFFNNESMYDTLKREWAKNLQRLKATVQENHLNRRQFLYQRAQQVFKWDGH